ncbi:MAG TPA: hypothetical protein GX726_00390 [Clostridiales bacterium]|nr:hypothetical protein [Clostridiales bacterium]
MRRFTRSKFSKRLAVGLFIIALLITVALAPFLAPYRSLAVMGLYDRYFEASSLPRDYGLKMQMPLRENGFFPFLINFQADAGMSAWFDQHLQNQQGLASKLKLRFTVEYSFAAFEPFAAHSPFYEPDGPLYGSYIGVYYLHGLGQAATEEEACLIPAFDQLKLALPSIGCPPERAVFELSALAGTSVRYLGYTGQRYDAKIRTNGPRHRRTSFQPAYLQFGNPPPSEVDYPVENMAGRIYMFYDAVNDLNIGVFAMAKDKAVVDLLDEEILSRAEISHRR